MHQANPHLTPDQARHLTSHCVSQNEDGRAAHFNNAIFVDVEDAGHWVHHDRLDLVVERARDFLAE